VAYQLEMRISEQVGDIVLAARIEVIDAYDIVALIEQAFA
jgi:hypothetical protein